MLSGHVSGGVRLVCLVHRGRFRGSRWGRYLSNITQHLCHGKLWCVFLRIQALSFLRVALDGDNVCVWENISGSDDTAGLATVQIRFNSWHPVWSPALSE